MLRRKFGTGDIVHHKGNQKNYFVQDVAGKSGEILVVYEDRWRWMNQDLFELGKGALPPQWLVNKIIGYMREPTCPPNYYHLGALEAFELVLNKEYGYKVVEQKYTLEKI